MHRQSLGSPASKLINSHGVLFSIAGVGIIKDDINNGGFTSEDHHRKDKIASSSPAAAADDDEHKSQKPYQQKSTLASSSSRLVHLIPLLTFLCFLVLYLSSHDPSRRDLAPFGGFTTLSSRKASIDSTDHIDNIGGGGSLEIQKSEVLAIRSMRNLQQQERHHRLHRKFGH